MKDIPSLRARLACLAVATFVSFLASSVAAQDGAHLQRVRGEDEVGVWFGGATTATGVFGGVKGQEASHRRFALGALRYSVVLGSPGPLSFRYHVEFVPFALASGVIVDRERPGRPEARDTVPAIGVNPIGFQLNLGRGRVQPFLSATGGFLLFTRPVPLPESGKLTFTGEAGAGVQVYRADHSSVMAGAKLHHVSNGGMEQVNRGLNSWVFYAGWSRDW